MNEQANTMDKNQPTAEAKREHEAWMVRLQNHANEAADLSRVKTPSLRQQGRMAELEALSGKDRKRLGIVAQAQSESHRENPGISAMAELRDEEYRRRLQDHANEYGALSRVLEPNASQKRRMAELEALSGKDRKKYGIVDNEGLRKAA